MNESKFSEKGKFYSAGRPGYPNELFTHLVNRRILTPNTVCADIGSGTGIFTMQLSEFSKHVFAIEPNESMRTAAKANFSSCNNITSVSATAEHTGIADSSVDLITVAQAFHWFDRDAFKSECQRILRGNGYVVLVWNDRDISNAVIKDNFEVNKKFCPEFKGSSNGMNFEKENFINFFCGDFEMTEFVNNYVYDMEIFINRNLSSSYSPKPNDARYSEYIDAIKAVFEKHIVNGTVNYPYVTRCYIGKVL